MSLDESITLIETFYSSKCDGKWEHQLGVKIESTDNPGWLVSINSLSIEKGVLSEMIGNLLQQHDAHVSTDGNLVRVFSPKLAECLMATGKLLSKGMSQDI